MKKIYFILVAMMLMSLQTRAQKHISVIDDDTHAPIAGVVIGDTVDVIARTSLQGMAKLPRRDGKIIFAHESYLRLEMDYDSIPQVVHMQRRPYNIDEVQVVGALGKKVNLGAMKLYKNPVDQQLKAAGNGNGNLLGWLGKLLFGRKSKKEAHKEKLQKMLDDY